MAHAAGHVKVDDLLGRRDLPELGRSLERRIGASGEKFGQQADTQQAGGPGGHLAPGERFVLSRHGGLGSQGLNKKRRVLISA